MKSVERYIKTILVFGTGRVGTSITGYFRDLGHNVEAVTRTEFETHNFTLTEKIKSADIIAAAIPDDLIVKWYATLSESLEQKTVIHFSGANTFEKMQAYHPLYSFPKNLVPSSEVSRITIAREVGSPPFSEVIPGANNPELEISAKDKAFYHALAVLSGNFSAFVWNHCASAFGQKWQDDPAATFGPYLESVIQRFKEEPQNSITGPIARRDQSSVNNNLESLADHPELLALYHSFLEQAWPEFGENNSD